MTRAQTEHDGEDTLLPWLSYDLDKQIESKIAQIRLAEIYQLGAVARWDEQGVIVYLCEECGTWELHIPRYVSHKHGCSKNPNNRAIQPTIRTIREAYEAAVGPSPFTRRHYLRRTR